MPAQEVREASEHDAAHHARRQRLAERSRPESSSTRLETTFGVIEPITGTIAITARHPIDRHVGSGDQPKERLPRLIRRLKSGQLDPNRLTTPRNPLEHLERDLDTRAEHNHLKNLQAGTTDRRCAGDDSAGVTSPSSSPPQTRVARQASGPPGASSLEGNGPSRTDHLQTRQAQYSRTSRRPPPQRPRAEVRRARLTHCSASENGTVSRFARPAQSECPRGLGRSRADTRLRIGLLRRRAARRASEAGRAYRRGRPRRT